MNGWMKLAAALFAAASFAGCSLLKVAVATGDPLSKEQMNVRTMTRGFYSTWLARWPVRPTRSSLRRPT